MRKTKLSIDQELLKAARIQVTYLIGQAKTSFFKGPAEECGNEQQALFSVVDEILGHCKEHALSPQLCLQDIFDGFS